ncbi:YlmC/YmxH family sporulation protein [Clostridium taeniosporum]|uniref:YlmC/YmxH family sporulation protein n=1 Tax=Clostridium taeniosporum TaxID=394958 RepID=A0A1D7XIN8_9CLOT|nr:YlmC/YmxH family sporulation protein [Clostridium taeniosporum]AOR23204.1 YlmC/YmxH family sporulation protein [Clostridium taeniosporum]
MEAEMYSLNAMRSMEIIDISTGRKLGFVKDFKVDCDDNKIISLILPGTTMKSWFLKDEEIEVKWDDIVKVGVDVILVKTDNIQSYDYNNG